MEAFVKNGGHFLSVISHASSGDSTVSRTGSGAHNTLPAALRTSRIGVGCVRHPRFANTEYAFTISIG